MALFYAKTGQLLGQNRPMRLLKTAGLAFSSPGSRRMDLVLLRLLLEIGFWFMTDGVHATNQ